MKLTFFGRDWTTLHSNRPQKKKNPIWQANEGIYTFHVLFLWLKNTYTVWLQDLIPPKVVDFENLKCAS